MRVVGLITRVGSGTISTGTRAGQDWQMLTVEGMRLFVPDDLQNGYERGQRVRMEVLHKGDKKLVGGDGKTVGYEAEYEMLTCEIVNEGV